MSAPRGLSPEEREAWDRLAATVKPLRPRSLSRTQAETVHRASPPRSASAPPTEKADVSALLANGVGSDRARAQAGTSRAPAPARPAQSGSGLDGHWDRRLATGSVAPDFTLDLHGYTLDAAHARLDSGLMQAKAMGARVVLLIAGKPRPVDAADRGTRRGAIRAKILDWLAAGPHGSDIAAIRKAHRRHGGEGALYLVLKRRR